MMKVSHLFFSGGGVWEIRKTGKGGDGLLQELTSNYTKIIIELGRRKSGHDCSSIRQLSMRIKGWERIEPWL